MERQASARNARRGATGNRRPPAQARADPHAAAAAAASSSSSSSLGSTYSSASSSVTSDATSRYGGGGEVSAASPAMVLRGCPQCFMYVMVQVQRERCPRCNTSALVRLFDG